MNKEWGKALLIVIFCVFLPTTIFAADPLPSWQENSVKKSIIDFVKAVTDKNNASYVAPADRIATIDNDGTLWVEQPLYTQMIFMLSRYAELAKNNPKLQKQPLFKAIKDHQFQDLTSKDLEVAFAATSANISVDEYERIAKKWLDTAKDPHFKQLYTHLVFQPMLEVLQYLKDNDFIIYIVSGGGQDFIRAFSEDVYHIPLNHVIGSTTKTSYTDKNNSPILLKLAKPLFISDHAGKPEAIDLFIGKKPIIAFGNSDGDREMLEWTEANPRQHLMLLVHHDDAKREYAYDVNSKVGTFSASLMTEATTKHWQVISMKNDWKVIFPFEKLS